MKVSVKRWLLVGVVAVGLGSTAAAMFGGTSSARDSNGRVDANAVAYDPAALPVCCALAGGWEQLFMNPGR